MTKILSGKVKKISPTEVSADRYDYLDLAQAEPDLGVPAGNDYALVSSTTGVRSWLAKSEIVGFTGSQGTTGFTGSTGTTGFTGSRGTTGFTGSQGIQGVIGFTGSKGDQGIIGLTGSRGFSGSVGFTGSQGIQGVTGLTGSQGIQGVIGFTGSKGDTGTNGTDGTVGFTGSRGATGFTGSQGVQGFTGSTGPIAGTDGQIIYNNGGISGGTSALIYNDTENNLEVKSVYAFDGTSTTLTTVTPTSIMTFSATNYGGGKFVIVAKDGVNRHVTELLVAHDGTTAIATEYATITTAGILATYDVDISGGNVRIMATSESTNSTVYKVSEMLMFA